MSALPGSSRVAPSMIEPPITLSLPNAAWSLPSLPHAVLQSQRASGAIDQHLRIVQRLIGTLGLGQQDVIVDVAFNLLGRFDREEVFALDELRPHTRNTQAIPADRLDMGLARNQRDLVAAARKESADDRA
uniref:Uncharacterized protein n=1 Tax=Novosphingobium sp. TVG9-VII TaxID=1028165 RepID=G4WYQ9_9SPHN|nr:hypothetical protein [Novosphingobium sp. TVG9-VII]